MSAAIGHAARKAAAGKPADAQSHLATNLKSEAAGTVPVYVSRAQAVRQEVGALAMTCCQTAGSVQPSPSQGLYLLLL